MKSPSLLLLVLAAATTPFPAAAQTIQEYVSGFITFFNATLIPFLFAVALLFFIWNVFRYFIAGGDNESDRETARQFAAYSVAAFVVIVSLWGIVNLFVSGFGLGGFVSPIPDYLENKSYFDSLSDIPGGSLTNPALPPTNNTTGPTLPSDPSTPNVPVDDSTPNLPAQETSSELPSELSLLQAQAQIEAEMQNLTELSAYRTFIANDSTDVEKVNALVNLNRFSGLSREAAQNYLDALNRVRVESGRGGRILADFENIN